MKLEHFGMAEPGDCRVVFSAAAEELEAAVQAEKDGPGRSAGEDDLLTAAVNRAILEGFSPLFAQLMKENNCSPSPTRILNFWRSTGPRASGRGRSSSACRRWNDGRVRRLYPAHPAPAYPGADHRA